MLSGGIQSPCITALDCADDNSASEGHYRREADSCEALPTSSGISVILPELWLPILA